MNLRIAPCITTRNCNWVVLAIQKFIPAFNFTFYGQGMVFDIPPIIGSIYRTSSDLLWAHHSDTT